MILLFATPTLANMQQNIFGQLDARVCGMLYQLMSLARLQDFSFSGEMAYSKVVRTVRVSLSCGAQVPFHGGILQKRE